MEPDTDKMAALKLSRRAMTCECEIVLGGQDATYLVEVGNLALDEIERLDTPRISTRHKKRSRYATYKSTSC